MEDATKTAVSNEDKLTKYISTSFNSMLHEHNEPKERVVVDMAKIAGRHAKRLGMSKKELERWLQSAYGRIWVRQTNLNPGLDMKDVRKYALDGYNKKVAVVECVAKRRPMMRRKPKSQYTIALKRHMKRIKVKTKSGTQIPLWSFRVPLTKRKIREIIKQKGGQRKVKFHAKMHKRFQEEEREFKRVREKKQPTKVDKGAEKAQ